MDFLRSKQSGVQHDFTGDLATSPDVFILDEVARYGFNSTISALSYDPIQSLLAVGTHAHADVSGEVHVFGQKRVHVKFTLSRKASVKLLRLCDTKIVILDSKNELTVFNLETPGARGVEYSPPGIVTVIETDPCLDWAFLGLQNGEVVAYDIDREALAPFRIPNFWRERSPKARLLPVVSLALHPKDVGTLLIGYNEGAVVYSFKQNIPVHYLQFELPPGAPGADTELAQIRTLRRPRLSQALWHPTGTFVFTAYEDSVMVIWNSRDGQIVQARTLQDANVHIPGTAPGDALGGDAGISIRQPIFKAAWCSTSNPDDTSLLIAGGNSMAMPAKGMALLDLGPTPNMLTSSVQVVSDHFVSPRRQRILPTPTDLDVVDFCPIPRNSAHYGGTHDPIAIIALLASGELVTLRFPDGTPLMPTEIFHPTLSLVHTFSTRVDVAVVNRQRWLGMAEQKQRFQEIVIGGIEHRRPLKRHENRTLAISSHPSGAVRIWDMGHADEIENQGIIELDLCRVLERGVDLKVDAITIAGSTGEAAVGMEVGEVVVFRWGKNKGFGRSAEDEELMANSRSAEGAEIVEGVVDVKMRTDPNLKEGLLPLCILDQKCGAVVAMKMSDVGFLAVAYQTGHLCVLDMRGPAVIYHQGLTSLSKEQKRSSFRKSREQPMAGEKATCLEFGVMTMEHDEFSSIGLFVGTSAGRTISFKILPAGAGYTCEMAGSATSEDGAIVSLHPLNIDTGALALATPTSVAGLRDAQKTHGVLIAVTKTSARIFKPPTAKGAHKSWSSEAEVCVSAALVHLEDYGRCLSCLLSTGVLKSYSIPGLKEIASLDLNTTFDPARLDSCRVLESAHILGWTGEHELELVYFFGKGLKIDSMPQDTLYNPELPPIPRPTISNLQWLSGTQYISTTDLDLLIGGPDRPMSRKQQEQLQQARMEEREAARVKPTTAAAAAAGSAEGGGGGVFANMTKTLRERTEKLTLTSDSIDRLGDHSANFADDVSKYVNQQKRKALLGGITGKWF